MKKFAFAKLLPMLEADNGGDIGGTGAEAQDITAPGSEEGEKEQEVTEPADEEDDTDDEPEEELEELDDSYGRDYERDSAYAQLRREKEESDRLIEELRQKVEQNNGVFESTIKGRINPYTDEPIETIEDYNAYLAEHEKRVLQEAGLPEDYIKKQIENNPTVKAAQAMMETQKQNQLKNMFDKELGNIQKLNPDIKSLEDLQTIENVDTFNTLVKGGMHIDKAYEVVHKLKGGEPRAKADTKGHMKTVGGNPAKNSPIPDDVRRMYKAINKGVTDKQIREHWNKRKEQ